MMALGKPKKGGISTGGDWNTNTELMTSSNAQHGGISQEGRHFLGGVRAIAGDEAMNHVYNAAKAMHGGNWWDDFTTGFAMPFKAIGSIAEKVLPVAQLVKGLGKYEGGAISELEGGIDPMALLNSYVGARRGGDGLSEMQTLMGIENVALAALVKVV